MKRFTMILALLLMIAMPMMAERVTPETARKVASTFLNNNGAKANQLTDLSKTAGFTNLYIFTTENSFVVMAADDRVKPILGYSLTGAFVAKDMPSNVRGWLQGYNDEIQSAIESQMRATAENTQLWKDLVDGNSKAARATTLVAPLIQTKWNQNKYYNDLCPAVSDGPVGKAYTGCVATAMAQIMKYWEYPTHGVGTHSYIWNGQTLNADFDATTYDWDNMADYYEYYYENGTAPNVTWLSNPSEEEIAAVATLMYHCGVSIEMEYGGNSTGGSGASTSLVAEALKTFFNYSPDIVFLSKTDYDDETWITMVKNELDDHRPLEYCGQDPDPQGGGHAFVCDGYNSDSYFHFNWGWSGHYDGYFSLDNLNTGANNESGSGNGVYTDMQGAVFGIQPVQCDASDPTNLTYTLSGVQDVTLSWTSANGAASYNIYRNNFLVGNTTEPSYTESAPFGTNVYFVRSVDANGIMSFSSNTVTVTIEYQTPIVDDLTATLSENNIDLTWSAPEWCYPETPSSTLTYGNQNNSGAYFPFGPNLYYWGHRHLAENLLSYQGLRLYSVEFHAINSGNYELCIYEGTNNQDDNDVPANQVYTQPVSVSTSGWNTIDLQEPYYINSDQDLWIFVHNTETFDNLQLYLCTAEGDYGVYYSSDPLFYTHNNASGYAFLIKAHLTDDTYTYNIYQDGTQIAQGLSQTTYNAALNNDAANIFIIKTNYYGGETEASNKIGFAKGNATLAALDLSENDQMTVSENSILTLSGTLSDENASNLILENGAQLVHNSADVKATVKKDIAAINDEQGWNFVASPVTESIEPSTENGFLNGTLEDNVYDLYYYDEPSHYWMNYKSNANSFVIEHKKGYLYANGDDTSLQFEGTLTPSNNTVTISNLSCQASELNGFNLVGNPFACNATIDQDCYIIDNAEGKVVLAEQDPVIAPCEGVFVKATASENSVTFTKSTDAKVNRVRNCFDLVIGQNRNNEGVHTTTTTIVDRARVRFSEGIGMEKYSMDDKHSQISLLQDGQDFAVAYANGEKEMPLNFKAVKNGTYTLSIEAEELELGYLHIIDNLTGNDVDLLATPSYTFEANTSDFPTRFKLLFAPICEDADGDNATFAYISDGNIIVNNANDVSLQIVDMMGRVVVEGDAMNPVSTSEMTSGVYVLRLINGEKVQTQKIVID